MSFQLSEVKKQAEFTALVETEHLAYQKPYNAFWEVLKGPNVEESWHTGTPGSHWLKATDNGKAIGGANWIIHKKNPFETPQPTMTGYWWTEGPLKSVSNHMLDTFFAGRLSVMNRRHLLANVCFIHPNYRRLGVGGLLIELGCKIADEMGLEVFVESTDDGHELYKYVGFIAVRSFFLDAQPSSEEEAKDPEWFKVKRQITPEPYRVWLMWRSQGGVFEDGETKFSWEETHKTST